MASLPNRLEFAQEEEVICEKWAKESTFKTQNRLSEERGDEVCLSTLYNIICCSLLHVLLISLQ
jgi:hypothetical protein